MTIRLRSSYFVLALLLTLMSSVNADEWQNGVQGPSDEGLAISPFCASYFITGQVSGPGDTNGSFGPFTPGDSFTFTATGNGTGTWRIVGDAGGVQTLTAGGTFPGTLTYSVPTGQTQDGVGFYVDTYTGTSDTITGTCAGSNIGGVPTLSFWSSMLMAMLLALIGLAAFRLKRSR